MAKKEVRINSNKEANKTVSQELLESVRGALYKLKYYLDSLEFNPEDETDDSKKATSIITIIEKMGRAFESLVIIEKRVQSEEAEKTKVRGGVKTGLFED
jgi:DNA repair ATPase RecN